MNLKPKEMLIVSPPYELHFVGPFDIPRVTLLKMKNPTDQTMLFKIKTTAPKRYCVRPNFGAISPNEVSSVEICLQPFNYDPSDKNKHKFMVQSMVAPPTTEGDDLNKLWKEAESSGQLMDVKLRCVFEMPAEENTNENNVAATATSSVDNANAKTNQSPRPPAEEKIEKTGSSDILDHMQFEMRYLRGENDELKEDNNKLKERLSQLMASSKALADEPYTPQFAEKQIPMFYIAIAIAAAIFGLVMGKFFL